MHFNAGCHLQKMEKEEVTSEHLSVTHHCRLMVLTCMTFRILVLELVLAEFKLLQPGIHLRELKVFQVEHNLNLLYDAWCRGANGS